MDVIPTRVREQSPEYQENMFAMEGLLATLRVRLKEVRQGGGAAAMERQVSRGKLPVRQRVERLLDPDTPFLEIGAFAAWGLYEGEAPSAGIVTGIGTVHGHETMVIANAPQ